MSLTFQASTHRYKLDGKPVPGVTTLIGKGIPKPALVYWSAKSVAEWVADNPADLEQMRSMGRGPLVAALKELPWQKRDEAAVRGTDVHAIAEKLVHGEQVDVPEHLAEPVTGYVDWLDKWQPEPIWTERPVGNRHWWYAGTFDIICTIAGQTWCLDWKTSSGVYGETALQLTAYGNAEFLVDHDGDERPIPAIDRYGVVHISPGETQLHEVKDPAKAWKDFLHAAWIANAADRIKNYLTEPLEAPAAPALTVVGAA
jgi:hypothetical protein